MTLKFTSDDLKQLWRPKEDSGGEDNGQVAIIGGSRLFHGAPMLAIRAASRLVDMVFFSSPEEELEKISAKAQLGAFIWVPWEEMTEYVEKAEAMLIGPGLMRFHSEKVKHEDRYTSCDEECRRTTQTTKYFLEKFKNKKWVVDGGSLQVMEKSWIPKRAVITPNKKEFMHLFGLDYSRENIEQMAKDHQCIVVGKGPVGWVSDGEITYEVSGGNAGLTKGGTGDTLAGIIVGLLAKNNPLLAAAAGNFLLKKTAERLFEKVGYAFNADDLANGVFETKKELVGY